VHIEENIILQKNEDNNPICAAEIEAAVLHVWEGLNLYTNDLFELVCNATPYAKCLFQQGYERFIFYIPVANQYYCIWRDGNFYHDYFFGTQKLQKEDVLEILYNKKKSVHPPRNGLQADSLDEIIKYVESLP